jgi:hypothetical protein
MGQHPGELPVVRGGCVRGTGMCWFEKLVDAAYRNGATIIRARAGSKFAFRIGGETQVIGTIPVREADLLGRLREVLAPGLQQRISEREDLQFEHAVVPWAPARAHIFRGYHGLVMSVWLGQGEDSAAGSAPAREAPVLSDADLVITPSVRDIDRLLTAGLGLGASQLLLKPGSQAVFRMGSDFRPISPNALSDAEVSRLLAEFLTPMEAATLRMEGDVDVDLAYPPFDFCFLHVFLSSGRPTVVATFPGVAVERPPALDLPRKEFAAPPPPPGPVLDRGNPPVDREFPEGTRGATLPSPWKDNDNPGPDPVFALLPKNPPFKPRPALRAAKPLPGPEKRDEDAGSSA